MADSLIIKETIDGREMTTSTLDIPASGGSKPREKKASDSKSSTAVRRADPYIWGIYIALLVVSVIELFSASSSEVSAGNVYMPLIRHGIFLVLGLALVLIIQNIHYKYISRVAVLMAVLSLGLLMASNFFGIEINGAQRAIKIAGFTIQPAEIVKYTVVILLARILGKEQTKGGITTKGVVYSAFVAVLFAACLWKNGLTNTLLLFMVSVAMFLIGGMKWKQFFIVMVIYGLCAGGLVMLKYQDDKKDAFDSISQTEIIDGGVDRNNIDRTRTQKGRIKRYLEGVSPDDEIDDYNRQVIFSKIAQANGGVFGQGPGNSRESARLPLAFSDYIFSIIVEDLGLVGGIALLILYMMLIARAGRIAYRCSRAIPSFMIMGCAVLIVLQALVHMAIVTGLFPVSGQPLPLISKGGTSVLVMSAAIGTMLSVSRYAVTTGDKKQIKAEQKELPEDMQALNYSTYSSTAR